ncbi:MAG TPA: nucleotidyltransferase domain-containing protein [Tepidisphaeraceae bacterium]
MVDLIEQHRSAIADLCRRLGVRKLELFGSVARGDFDRAESDVDFLCEFDENPIGLANRFFELLEGLEQLLGRKVDLVSSRDVSNPYFLQVVNRDRVTLYAA